MYGVKKIVREEHYYQCDGCGKVYTDVVATLDGRPDERHNQTESIGAIEVFTVACPWPVGGEHESQEIELHVCSRECLMQAAGQVLWPVKDGDED